MSTSRVSVLVVDDNPDLASALARLLEDEPDLACAGVAHDADDLPGVIARSSPAVVLLDRTMPVRDPLEAMAEAAIQFPQCRFIVVSGYDDPSDVDQALDHGAWGFVSKASEHSLLLAAIRSVAAGEIFCRRGPE